MRGVICEGQGGVEVLRWGEVPDVGPPGPGELTLAVEAAALNRADLLQRQGFYPPPPGASAVLGLEAAGRVTAVGPGVEGVAVGDLRMALLAGGGQAERVVVDARHTLPVPAAIGLPAAGGVMEVFLTAYLNLFELGGLQAGERVLIHGGSGGVGQAALQLARRAGAEVWTTASAAKLERCRAAGADRAFDYAQADVAAEAKAAGGVALVLDVLGAGGLAANLRALAPDGRLVVIGLQQGRTAELDLGLLLVKRLRLQGSTLRALDAERKAGIVARFAQAVWPALDAGELTISDLRSQGISSTSTATDRVGRDLAQ